MSEAPGPAAAEGADAARPVANDSRISAAQLAAAQRIRDYWWSRAATLQHVADATVAVVDGQPRAERFDDGHDAR